MVFKFFTQKIRLNRLFGHPKRVFLGLVRFSRSKKRKFPTDNKSGWVTRVLASDFTSKHSLISLLYIKQCFAAVHFCWGRSKALFECLVTWFAAPPPPAALMAASSSAAAFSRGWYAELDRDNIFPQISCLFYTAEKKGSQNYTSRERRALFSNAFSLCRRCRCFSAKKSFQWDGI